MSGNHVSIIHSSTSSFSGFSNLADSSDFCDLQVPPMITKKIFSQVFSFINVQLLNRWVEFQLQPIQEKFQKGIEFSLKPLIKAPNLWFGSLLLRRECCSFSNGEYLKAGLQELEHWCLKTTDQVVKIVCTFCQDWKEQRRTLYNFVVFTVCRIVLGWTPTHKASCRVSGTFSWTQMT